MTWLRRTLLEIEQMRRAEQAARPKWIEFHVAYQPQSPAVGRVAAAGDTGDAPRAADPDPAPESFA